MSTTMEQLNSITAGFNKCKPMSEIFSVFDEANKKVKKSLEEYYASKERKEEIKEVKKKEIKKENKEVKEESPNVILLGHTPKETSKDTKKEESKFENKKEVKKTESKKELDVITLENRTVCPVHVMTNEERAKLEKNSSKKVDKKLDKEEEHRLHHLIHHLNDAEIQFSQPQKMSTGLYEFDIIQTNGNPVLISVDNDGIIYSDEIKFFIGHMNPGDEYEPNRPCVYMTKESLNAVKNNQPIPDKYIVPQEMFILNKLVDLSTLKEKDLKKRSETFKNLSKIMTDQDVFNGVIKNANGEPYRFAFCRYTSPNEFSIVSSKRNLLSNLTDEKLRTTKEMWINYKDGNVDLKCKKLHK